MLIYSMSVSVDGFIADREGAFGWGAPSDELFRFHLARVGELGGYLLGRRLYESMLVWETDPSPRDDELGAEFADVWRSLPKVVFSQSLETVDWANARLSRRPLEDEIPELKREGGKDMVVFGGARIAHSLIRLGLFDELRLTVHPVALGDGLPLMHGLPEPQRFTLVSSTAYADGCVTQVLRPA